VSRAELRFVPSLNNPGKKDLIFKAWDRTNSDATKVDTNTVDDTTVSRSSGGTPFSASSVTLSVDVVLVLTTGTTTPATTAGPNPTTAAATSAFPTTASPTTPSPTTTGVVSSLSESASAAEAFPIWIVIVAAGGCVLFVCIVVAVLFFVKRKVGSDSDSKSDSVLELQMDEDDYEPVGDALPVVGQYADIAKVEGEGSDALAKYAIVDAAGPVESNYQGMLEDAEIEVPSHYAGIVDIEDNVDVPSHYTGIVDIEDNVDVPSHYTGVEVAEEEWSTESLS
jgi:hypothetical protein